MTVIQVGSCVLTALLARIRQLSASAQLTCTAAAEPTASLQVLCHITSGRVQSALPGKCDSRFRNCLLELQNAMHRSMAHSLQGTAQDSCPVLHQLEGKGVSGKVSPSSWQSAGDKKHTRGSWRSMRCGATHWAWTATIAITGESCFPCRQAT